MIDIIFLEKLERIINQSIYVVNESGEVCALSQSNKVADVAAIDHIKDNLLHIMVENPKPFIYIKGSGEFWGVCPYIEEAVIVGPFVSMGGSKSQDSRRLKEIKPFSPELLTKFLNLIHLELNGQDIAEEDIKTISEGMIQDSVLWNAEESLEIYQLFQSENDREHTGGIAVENELYEIVKRGDVLAMRQLLDGYLPELNDISELASSEKKRMEYVLVATITIITRAAVEGKLNAEEAYALGDVYIRQLESCNGDTAKMYQIGISAQLDFTQRVYDAKQRRSQNVLIEKSKDYIAKNLRKDISVAKVAEGIEVSQSYLSHKFSEIEGITIQHYIAKEKCSHAANLLKYSDYPISLISEYFGFATQSHFGSQFKKLYGITPSEYRANNTK